MEGSIISIAVGLHVGQLEAGLQFGAFLAAERKLHPLGALGQDGLAVVLTRKEKGDAFTGAQPVAKDAVWLQAL